MSHANLKNQCTSQNSASNVLIDVFIAPLWKSGGYTGFALSFRHSVVLSFCGSVIVIAFEMKLEYLWSQLANLDQVLDEASWGWGKGCIRFWDRLDQNSGFHGNRKCPLTYNGENDVSTFSLLFLFRSFSNLQVMRTGIKSQTSEFRPDRTTPYRVRCPWASEKCPIDL